ncbi:trypsin-like serine protease [Actinosynnema sp. NPDC020468]|uniref:trypsin-like serine protease n=1 Tax=Actinosynnema sp. NPDC020468 TaxID=3154488 RepID=UPI0034075B7B
MSPDTNFLCVRLRFAGGYAKSGGLMIAMRVRKAAAVVVAALSLGVLVLPGTSGASAQGPVRERAAGESGKFAGTSAAGIVADGIGVRAYAAYVDTFAGIEVDPTRNRVVVYTTDPVAGAALVREGVRATSEAVRADVDVEVRSAKYSQKRLQEASAGIWSGVKEAGSQGVEVYSIALKHDGSGVEVRTNSPAKAPVLTAQGGVIAGADVHYVAGFPSVPTSREDPAPPWQGGIPIRNAVWPDGWDCTAAFGLHSGATDYLLTAEHCFPGGTDIEDLNGDPIGEIAVENTVYDSALIPADSQAGVWVNDEYAFDVRQSKYSWNGEYVCQSGYTSYPNKCAIEVVNHYVEYDFGDGGGVRHGVEGHRCAGCSAVARGDSGGPVWSTHPDTGLYARGVVSGGHTPVGSASRLEYIYFTEVPLIAATLGVSLITS